MSGLFVRTLGLVRSLMGMLVILSLAILEPHAAGPYVPVHPDPVLEPWRWQSFPELKGLGLQCMAEDSDGNKWFGTDEGARRYDGMTWTVYTAEDGLYGAPVTALRATREGSLYAGPRKGISRFREGKWSRFFPPKGDLDWNITQLREASDGSIWAATGGGALHLTRGTATLYTDGGGGAVFRVLAPDVQVAIVPDRAVPAYAWPRGFHIGILIESHGVIWALAAGGAEEAAGLRLGDRVIAIDGESRVVSMGRLNGPSGDSVRLRVQRQGRPDLFEVTVTRGPVKGTYRNFALSDVLEDRGGSVWFGLFSGEIVRYDPGLEGRDLQEGDTWRLYTAEDGLDTGFRPRMTQAGDGTIWMGRCGSAGSSPSTPSGTGSGTCTMPGNCRFPPSASAS